MHTNDHHVRLVARLARMFETRLGEDSMTLPQYRVLAFLSEGEWAASKLADMLAVSRPSVTAVVDGLVDRGWVERRESPEDRRRVLHQLTPAGRATLERSTDELGTCLDGVLEHLDAAERSRALDGLELLSTGMRRHWEAVASA